MYLKDGSVYKFDPLGRLEWYTDSSGKNRVEVVYNGLVIDYIKDSMDRKIRFARSILYRLPGKRYYQDKAKGF